MRFWKNYRSTILLIVSIIIGTILGLIFKENILFLKPLGDLFINLLYVVIVPLIFLTITTSIFKMSSPKRLGKVMITTIVTFLGMSIVALLLSFFVTFKVNLVDNKLTVLESNVQEVVEVEKLNILERTIDVLTVEDFTELLSKDNIIALLVISIITGIAIMRLGKNADPLKKVLLCANDVILKIVEIIFMYAPIGLGVFFATSVATMGSSIAIGYLKTFIIYFIVAILYFVIIYSLIAYFSGGLLGLKRYWSNILPALLTAAGTCSSAASIPINIKTANSIGVSEDVADTVIPMGTSFHKDGSIIGSVFKIMFIVSLMGVSVNTIPDVLKILGVAFVANILITAVPIGGGTISEAMILSLMGFPMSLLPVLTIIATIIDAPATVLNVTGDTVSSMVVSRIVDGRNWLKKEY